MKKPMKRLIFRIFLAGIFFAGLPYLLLAVGIHSSEFRRFAQSKAAEYLKADVTIRKIKPAFFNRIILSDFSIQASPGTLNQTNRLEVDKIVFKYSLKQLFLLRLTVPNSIILKSPRVLIKGLTGLPAFWVGFSPDAGPHARDPLASLEFSRGEIRYNVPAFKDFISMSEIQGVLKPVGGSIRGSLRAKASGMISGDLRVAVQWDLTGRKRFAEIEMVKGSFREGYFPEGNQISFKAHIQDKDLFLDFLEIRTPERVSRLNGSLASFSERPILRLSGDSSLRGSKIFFQSLFDFSAERLEGFLDDGFQKTGFRGRLFKKDAAWILKDLKLENGYLAEAFFSPGDLSAKFFIEKATKRIRFETKFEEPQWTTFLSLDHFNVYGLDLICSGKLLLAPQPVENSLKRKKFKAHFDSTLFILDSLPFEDFQGEFSADADGIHELNASWGDAFKGTGEIRFQDGRFYPDLAVRVHEFNLREVKNFASKPLPREMGGELEGLLRLSGQFPAFQAVGNFTVSDGFLGKIEYDRAIIQLSGITPYFKILDSKVVRGRSSIPIEGALDLSLRNIFAGVSIQSPDNVIVWRGADASLQELKGNLDLEVSSGVKQFPELGISFESGSKDKEETTSGSSEKSVTIGPRFKF